MASATMTESLDLEIDRLIDAVPDQGIRRVLRVFEQRFKMDRLERSEREQSQKRMLSWFGLISPFAAAILTRLADKL